MPAIITDQYRILNAETFIDSFVGIGTTGNNNYYTFLGHPNPKNVQVKNYGFENWGSPIPDPIDSFSQENFYHDSMLFLKKVTSDDVRRVIPRINWQSNSIYDMYRNNYHGKNSYTDQNLTPQTKSTTLYGSNYYVVTSEFKVYICINNGSDPLNPDGAKSLFEPTHTNTAPQPAGDDGYLWKYLFSVSPSDIVKFVTSKYIPLPKKWGDATNENIKNAAVDGKIETIIVKDAGTGISVGSTDAGTVSQVPISGDGSGGSATVKIKGGSVDSITVVGGSNYTYANLRFITGTYVGENGNNVELGVPASTVNQPNFEVVIPPKGGHGSDIYRELGGFRVMLYSKYDNNVDDAPDYVIGNDFSRVGIIKNPQTFTGNTLLNSTTATSLGALALTSDGAAGVSTTSQVTYATNSIIKQTVGVGSTAVAYVASWNPETGILKYYQPVGFSTLASYSYKQLDFIADDNAPIINANAAGGDLIINKSFNDDSISTASGKNVALSQSFITGMANPDIKKYSGDIIYVDNRAPITRSTSQKEEINIVIEF